MSAWLRHFSRVEASTKGTLYLAATVAARCLARAMALGERVLGKERWEPRSTVSPASSQPMVPPRRAATLLGMPALIRDWAPMMLRVRPAQLTTTNVSGSGAISAMR